MDEEMRLMVRAREMMDAKLAISSELQGGLMRSMLYCEGEELADQLLKIAARLTTEAEALRRRFKHWTAK
jgi:hypothetical protein